MVDLTLDQERRRVMLAEVTGRKVTKEEFLAWDAKNLKVGDPMPEGLELWAKFQIGGKTVVLAENPKRTPTQKGEYRRLLVFTDGIYRHGPASNEEIVRLLAWYSGDLEKEKS